MNDPLPPADRNEYGQGQYRPDALPGSDPTGGDLSGRDRSAPHPWTDSPQDPDGAALAEGWNALDQLIRGAKLTEFDAAAQARLVRGVERRSRRRTLAGWGAAAAVAAALLLMLPAIRSGTPDEIAGTDELPNGPVAPGEPNGPVESGNSVGPNGPGGPTPHAAPTASPPDRELARTEPDAAALREALRRAEAERAAAEFWSDDYDADLQSARLQAREVELSWQRGSEPLTDLRQRFDELQADWNERSL